MLAPNTNSSLAAKTPQKTEGPLGGTQSSSDLLEFATALVQQALGDGAGGQQKQQQVHQHPVQQQAQQQQQMQQPSTLRTTPQVQRNTSRENRDPPVSYLRRLHSSLVLCFPLQLLCPPAASANNDNTTELLQQLLLLLSEKTGGGAAAAAAAGAAATAATAATEKAHNAGLMASVPFY